MLKRLLCSTLLLCSFGTHAGNWQKEFFSSMSNELPASRGVAVDDLGFVHLQAFNKQPWGTGYDFAHLYTLNAQGQAPWIWGLTQVDRKSDCGVYAKSGQRLDCFRTAGYNGDDTRLEMRSRYDAYPVWQARLPGEVELLDASIPVADEALIVGKLTGPWGDELGVFRIAGYGAINVLSVTPTCPHPGQSMIMSRFRMPKQDSESIRHIKACWNSFGTTELILETFDPYAGQWTALSTWEIAYGEQLLHADINAEGKAFALIEHKDGLRELLRTPVYADQWETLPFPIEGKITAFLVGPQGLVVASLPPAPEVGSVQLDTLAYTSVQIGGLPMTVGWFDMNAYWPMMQWFPQLSDVAPQSFALSSQGALIIVGASLTQPNSQQLWLANHHGQVDSIASLPLAANETAVGKTYLIGGPDNAATIARTIRRDGMQIGVRVDQYALPFSP
ncbi:MAG: hypothetical protein HOP03_02865 [Lysobacter sp.]|nr:hypothetical protein [Lysobacter sp.]